MDKYTRSDSEDGRHIVALMDGKRPRRFKRWHSRGVPTYLQALQLAERHGVQRLPDVQVIESFGADDAGHRTRFYHVTLRVRYGGSIRAGSSRNADAYIAMECAFRNGIRQVLADAEKLAA